jgi:hypothetical protein
MTRIPSLSVLAAFVGAVLVVLGCMGAASPASAPRPVAGNPSSNGDGGDGSADEEPGGDQAPGQAITGPLVIHTGSLAMEVADLRPAIDQATAVVTGLGGNVAASHEQNFDGVQSASVTFRIPAPSWTEAVSGIRAVATKVVSEDTDAEDVTARVVDLDARIANLRVSETALQQIMTQATTIPDVLNVQEELTSVRGEIESMTAQRDHLADQAALGTLEVHFNVPTAQSALATGGWDLGREADRALAALVRVGQGLASLAVWVLIVIVPLLVPVLIAIWIGLLLRRRISSRSGQPGTPAI